MYLAFDPRAPLSYRLRRIGIWTAVEAPPRSADGQTMVAAPDPDRLGRLDRLVALAGYRQGRSGYRVSGPGTHFSASTAVICAPWRSGNWATGTTGRGTRSRTGNAVFRQRLPGIETLCFSGGAPFAAPRTRSWLYALESSNGARRDAAASEDSVPRTISKARGQAAAGELRGGIATLSAALRGPGRQNPFSSEHGAGGLLIEGRQFAHARLQGNEIVRLIDKFDLTDWDPGQAIDGLTALLPCLTSRDDDPPLADPLRDRVHALLGRIGPDRLSMTGPIAG